jgi:hypothetical protein
MLLRTYADQWRLIPMLVLLYLIAYLDKTNIGKYSLDYGMLMTDL